MLRFTLFFVFLFFAFGSSYAELVSESGQKAASSAFAWKTNSVLSSGKWVKVKTKAKGIYKITFDQLKQWGFSAPEQVSMYGNGGFMLPTQNKDTRADDLLPYPIMKGKDNSGKDCLFFYSSGNILVGDFQDIGNIAHKQNYYATETYFYLSDQGTIKLIDKGEVVSASANKIINTFSNYSFYERELVNLLASGSQWFGEEFKPGQSQQFNLMLENPDFSQPIKIEVVAAGKSSAASAMSVSVNAKLMADISFKAVSMTDPTSYFADIQTAKLSMPVSSNTLQVKLAYSALNSPSNSWLDYISVNYKGLLEMSSDVFSFRGKGAENVSDISEFVLKGATAATKVIDVTDISNASELPTTFSDGQLKFKSSGQTMREYVAFNLTGALPVPELVGTVVNQNLHAGTLAEMIIVSAPSLLPAANELASFHRDFDGLTVQVVVPEIVYNEFSGGLPDPGALRNYFRMCYDLGKQNGNEVLKYVLLLGDGSYDNRNILGKGHNLLPTYQSENSLSPVESYVADDFYGFLDLNEGGISGDLDIGIGRIPAGSLADAAAVVNKIKNYHNKESLGNWRNVVTFIGDDEDANTHMLQSERLATFVNATYPGFFTDKIYFDAYKQISTSSGEKYPDVTTAINNRVKQGTLVMNYIGHANEKNLAAENVLDITTINSWGNHDRLPIFVTATCDFSRFDADHTTAGETILFNPQGGGVGLFSTTRLVYSGANFVLNSEFFKHIFEKDAQGNSLRLGDVMRKAKNGAKTGSNQLSFSLLADPAIRLAQPSRQVITTHIDGKEVGAQADTIRTLSQVTVKGFIAGPNGEKLSSFNGEIIPTVYDKAMKVETLGNGGQKSMEYSVQNSVIYKGLASVKNGEFEFSFFVPKDISYKFDKGKILYYAYNETIDAQGYFDDFYIGGASGNIISDKKGPEVKLYLNDDSFVDGQQVSASSLLIATISDETGINTSGTGIGHDITAVLDDNYLNIMILNEYFQAYKDRYTSGKIVFPLTGLAEGEHKLKLKVWDVLNNSTEVEIRFMVKDGLRIESVSCYPNPMQGQARFVFSHNHPDEPFDVRLDVFEISGSQVCTYQTKVVSSGTNSLPFEWIPANQSVRMRQGVYIYRLTATTSNGKTGSGAGKFVYVNH